jgi:kynurenine formamidase
VRHNWGVFGEDDEVGTLNFLCPGCRRRAAAEVLTGELLALSMPLDQPSPSLVETRAPYRHEVATRRSGRDDALHNFYLQGSSQWDGLQHIRYREFGYYNGLSEADLDEGRLGIDRAARHGILTRGVLADVAGYLASIGRPIEATARCAIDAELLDRTLAWQGVVVESGDIVLVRTGWLGWYQGLAERERIALAGRLRDGPDGIQAPGLDARAGTAEWLWNHQVAAVAADNASLEVLRVRPDEGYLHRLLIPLLGMMLGELWQLDELATRCAERRSWTFLLSAAPMMLPGGVGSPCNAYAVL